MSDQLTDAAPLRSSGERLTALLTDVEITDHVVFRSDSDVMDPPSPMDYAKHAAKIQDTLDEADAIVKDLKGRLATRGAQIEKLMENEQLAPDGFKAGGRSFHVSRQLWASPKDGDHAALTEILDQLGLDEYKPKTVNSQSFSAYVREHLDPDETLPLETRLLNDNPKPLPPELYAAIKASIKPTLRYPKS